MPRSGAGARALILVGAVLMTASGPTQAGGVGPLTVVAGQGVRFAYSHLGCTVDSKLAAHCARLGTSTATQPGTDDFQLSRDGTVFVFAMRQTGKASGVYERSLAAARRGPKTLLALPGQPVRIGTSGNVCKGGLDGRMALVECFRGSDRREHVRLDDSGRVAVVDTQAGKTLWAPGAIRLVVEPPQSFGRTSPAGARIDCTVILPKGGTVEVECLRAPGAPGTDNGFVFAAQGVAYAAIQRGGRLTPVGPFRPASLADVGPPTRVGPRADLVLEGGTLLRIGSSHVWCESFTKPPSLGCGERDGRGFGVPGSLMALIADDGQVAIERFDARRRPTLVYRTSGP